MHQEAPPAESRSPKNVHITSVLGLVFFALAGLAFVAVIAYQVSMRVFVCRRRWRVKGKVVDTEAGSISSKHSVFRFGRGYVGPFAKGCGTKAIATRILHKRYKPLPNCPVEREHKRRLFAKRRPSPLRIVTSANDFATDSAEGEREPLLAESRPTTRIGSGLLKWWREESMDTPPSSPIRPQHTEERNSWMANDLSNRNLLLLADVATAVSSKPPPSAIHASPPPKKTHLSRSIATGRQRTKARHAETWPSPHWNPDMEGFASMLPTGIPRV